MRKFSAPIFNFYFAISLLLVVFCFNQKLVAQSYQFNKYSVDQGLPQQYIYSLNQDDKGFIWVGTGDGISRFDGIEFKNYTTKDGLAENFVSCSGQAKNNVIWLGHNKGGISRISDGTITTIVPDSLVNSKITSLIVDKDNYVWASSQNGHIIKISPKLMVETFDLFHNEKMINCIAGKQNENLIVGTNDGLLIYKLNKLLQPKNYTEVNGFKSKNIQCITKSNYLESDYWIGTAESGLFQMRFVSDIKHKVRSSGNSFGIGNAQIKNIEEDARKNLLVSTFSGLFKLIYDEETKGYEKTVSFNSGNGIEDFVNLTLTDREGNLWIGLYGSGLAMLKDEIFVFYMHDDVNSVVPNDTRSFLFQDSVKWFGMSNGLLRISPYEEVKWKYYNAENGFKNVAVNSIISYGDDLFLATDGEGLYKFNTQKETFKKEYLVTSYLSNTIYDVQGHYNDIWLATEGGLIIKNVVTGVTQHYNTLNGLKHNSIYSLKMLSDGSVIIGSHSNHLTHITKDEISHQLISDENQLMDVVSIDVDASNNLWIATLGNGIFKQQADSFIQVTSNDGLKSDYCYSIISDQNNGVWVGHRGGLSRISNESLTVDVYDNKKGISDDFNQGAVYLDEEKNIWFGTNKRTIKFNQKKFIQNTTPPFVSIKNILLSDIEMPIKDGKIEVDYSSYKLKIEFIGISFKQPDKVKYQYFLEGYDIEWSESSSLNTVSYPRIDDGEYTFYVKACNSDGYCSEETKAFVLIIDSPFWKKWWFIVACIAGLLFIIYSFIKIREKNQKEIQRKLEKELEIRTHEVVKKSEELENKNKNITDSINYALRIQKSILPAKKLMRKYFPESFVFYKPRDIVSGDFYWYEKIGNKFIVACADCTGHGVPGAFMSMISSTLFKEIAHRYKITDPSKFLYKLDSLLNSTLKKTSKDKIHDGLDVSVCVFDLDTNEMQFSGAYRPILIHQKGSLERIKSTPHSIGGDDLTSKEFITKKFQLNKGDTVYMFSDGYPDQFGGEKGKKLYLKGFESLVSSILAKEMNEQQEIFAEFFDNWSSSVKQIDDVLVIGVKIK